MSSGCLYEALISGLSQTCRLLWLSVELLHFINLLIVLAITTSYDNLQEISP